MKKSVMTLLLVCSIVFLSSCNAEAPADHMELIGDSGYQTSDKASDENTSLNIDPHLKNDLEGGRRAEFPLHYQITPPGQSFLDSLNQAYTANYSYLRDRDDFFEIEEDYLLYMISDALVTPSKLRLKTPTQTVDILTVTKPIQSISFYSSHELCVALVNAYEGNGEIAYISYYLLDLQNGTLSLLFDSEFVLKYGHQYRMYDNILIKEEYPSLDRNDSVDVYHVMQSEEIPSLSGIQLPCYANGLIYYKRNNILYCSGFDGAEKKLFSLEFEVNHMQVLENTLICVSAESDIYAVDLESLSITSVHADPDFKLAFADERGVFLQNYDERILSFISYDGEAAQIATDFKSDGSIYVGDNWVYYRTVEYSQEVDYYVSHYWKLGIGKWNMGELTPL